jgi:hypothetical protein
MGFLQGEPSGQHAGPSAAERPDAQLRRHADRERLRAPFDLQIETILLAAQRRQLECTCLGSSFGCNSIRHPAEMVSSTSDFPMNLEYVYQVTQQTLHLKLTYPEGKRVRKPSLSAL